MTEFGHRTVDRLIEISAVLTPAQRAELQERFESAHGAKVFLEFFGHLLGIAVIAKKREASGPGSVSGKQIICMRRLRPPNSKEGHPISFSHDHGIQGKKIAPVKRGGMDLNSKFISPPFSFGCLLTCATGRRKTPRGAKAGKSIDFAPGSEGYFHHVAAE